MGCRKRSAANGVSIKGPPAPGPLDTLINYGALHFQHPVFATPHVQFLRPLLRNLFDEAIEIGPKFEILRRGRPSDGRGRPPRFPGGAK